MTYLVDAQLPYLLAEVLRQKGYDVVHTDDLPDKAETSDTSLRALATRESRIVITKDSDFQDSYLLFRQPPRLLLLTTGNIKNRVLLDLFRQSIETIDALFEHHSFVELNNVDVLVHE
ncbi:DUF5615 family PIN-like protein [Spirosoma utsteinense]|uniref:Nuclease of putative toxin-antitoxin system n=1 Tax=Spirosoma utsteinense TaxID=2585773 RepID=A0ABR6W427_9BACT|nr:DUF5615 family PIN-like protein [Spirosoma utsteinense]MBC3787103.1 putative nuclease of putative toxin-antitoxin system [Spirosoma utsteinense]MBC3791347.1 putative nuclease of putative toxin-antitoxin system [Spirosoma utsteinense]